MLRDSGVEYSLLEGCKNRQFGPYKNSHQSTGLFPGNPGNRVGWWLLSHFLEAGAEVLGLRNLLRRLRHHRRGYRGHHVEA